MTYFWSCACNKSRVHVTPGIQGLPVRVSLIGEHLVELALKYEKKKNSQHELSNVNFGNFVWKIVHISYDKNEVKWKYHKTKLQTSVGKSVNLIEQLTKRSYN